jgi:hypothetical protein
MAIFGKFFSNRRNNHMLKEEAPMTGAYKYFLADPKGVTHKILSDAEILADQVSGNIRDLEKFAGERHFSLVLIQYDSINIPAFRPINGSVMGKDLVTLAEFLGDSSFSRRNLYIAQCFGNPGICCAHKNFGKIFPQFESFRNIENKIVKAARKAAIEVTTPVEYASVNLGSNITLHARSYKVLLDWIYKSPISSNGTSFVPPQSRLLAASELDKLTLGQPLHDWKCEHRRIWDRLNKLEKVAL